MEQWDNYFPPLNLWNYNLYSTWFEDITKENLSDGPAPVIDWVKSNEMDCPAR